MKRIHIDDLLQRLDQIDEVLIEYWLHALEKPVDDQYWERFVDDLEQRVSILVTLRDSGFQPDPSMIWPAWLQTICQEQMGQMKDHVVDLVREKNVKKRIRIFRELGEP